MRHAEAISLAIPLTGIGLFSAMYLNEILMRVIEPQTPCQRIFHQYLNALATLAQDQNPEPALRRFELQLLQHLGYGVDFSHCAGSGDPIDSQMTYLFRPQMGFIASMMKHPHVFQGESLKAMATGDFPNAETLKAAKRFTRLALKPYLGSKPLKSRELFYSEQGKPRNEHIVFRRQY